MKVFELINGVWSQVGNTLFGNSPGDSFGFSLSLLSSGSFIAVGARYMNVSSNQPGSAYIFENQGGHWVLVHNPIVGVALGDQAGFSVALTSDGSKVAVSSTGNDAGGSNSGHVRVFENSSILNIDEKGNENWVKVVPNPATDFIKIRNKEVMSSYTISSLDGKIVKQTEGLNHSEFDIDIHDLTSGMYVLTLQTKSLSRSLKLFKQ